MSRQRRIVRVLRTPRYLGRRLRQGPGLLVGPSGLSEILQVDTESSPSRLRGALLRLRGDVPLM